MEKKVQKLETFLDQNGLLRLKTRLTNREDLNDFRFPIVLPNTAPEVIQLIMDLHKKYNHAGVGILLVKLRKKYWILRARQTVKRVIRSCVKCQRFTSKPASTPTAPLPIDRIKDSEVFEILGVDLAGPMMLKNGKKIWFAIFTCAVYRAVYFELIDSLSTATFLNALERFIEKFRRPTIIYSDNGTNFSGAANLLQRIDWRNVEDATDTQQIKWKFIPPISAWWGGWWERLIRSTKDLLYRTLGNKTVHRKQLKSVLQSIADVLNDRPLTYISEDNQDLEPLTPSLFLRPFGKATFPEKIMLDAEKLRYSYKYALTLQKELKGRFQKEYLGMLVGRSKTKGVRDLQVGDLVFVGNDNQKRLQWSLGRIQELFPGKDGVSRVALVRTKDGFLTRTVQRLHLLELDGESESLEKEACRDVITRSGRRVKVPGRFK